MIAHSAGCYAVSAAVKCWWNCLRWQPGLPWQGPLGTLVGTLAGSKQFGRCLVLYFFLWMFIIANMIELYSIIWVLQPPVPMQMRHSPTSLQISETERSKFCKTQTIRMRFCRSWDTGIYICRNPGRPDEKYADATLVVVDEFGDKTKKSLSYYLSVMFMDKYDNSTISSFLGYSNVTGLDMDTNLSTLMMMPIFEAARDL